MESEWKKRVKRGLALEAGYHARHLYFFHGKVFPLTHTPKSAWGRAYQARYEEMR